MDGNFFIAYFCGSGLLFLIFAHLRQILLGRFPDYLFQRFNNALVTDLPIFHCHLAALYAAGCFNDHAVFFLHLNAGGIKIIHLAHLLKSHANYFRHGSSILFLESAANPGTQPSSQQRHTYVLAGILHALFYYTKDSTRLQRKNAELPGVFCKKGILCIFR